MTRSSRHPALLFVGPFPPPVHGQSVSTASVYAMLSKHGLTIRAIDSGEGGDGAAPVRRALRQIRAASTILRSRAPGLYLSVNANKGMLLTIWVSLAGRLSGKSLTLHHHSYGHIGARSSLMGWLGRAAGPRALHIAICPSMSAELAARYPAVQLTGSYSNIAVFDDPGSRPARKAGPLTLGHMSNLTEEKGLGRAIDAFRAVRQRRPGLKLSIAGPCADAYSREAVERARAEFGADFIYAGPVHGEDKRAFFDGIDIFLFPSRFANETQGIVNLEALSFGKPVVAYGQCCIARDIGSEGGVAIDPSADFSAALRDYMARYDADPDGASSAARRRYETLLALHKEECNAMVARFGGHVT